MLMRLFFRSRWTVIALAVIISAVLVAVGKTTVAGILLFLVIGFVEAIRSHHIVLPLSKAYVAGAWTGAAGLLWIWALTAFLPILLLILWPLRARNYKVLISALLGLATPWWIYLPYYMFKQL